MARVIGKVVTATKIYFDSAYFTPTVAALGSHTQNTDTGLGALGTKNPPIDADKAIYRDSTASDALVTSTWTQIKAFLKTYFDGIYQAALGFTPENVANKQTDLTASATKYPTVNAVNTGLAAYLPLAGGVITGNLGFSSELVPAEENVEHTGQSTIILDATTAAVSANIADGGSYTNMILFVICVDVTNGAGLTGTIVNGSGGNYTFTAAGECLILKQTNTTSPAGWWIVGKYTP